MSQKKFEETALRRSKSGGVKFRSDRNDPKRQKPAQENDEVRQRRAIAGMLMALERGMIIKQRFAKKRPWDDKAESGREVNKKGKYKNTRYKDEDGYKFVGRYSPWFEYRKVRLHVSINFSYGKQAEWPRYTVHINGRGGHGDSAPFKVPAAFGNPKDKVALKEAIMSVNKVVRSMLNDTLKMTRHREKIRQSREALNKMGEVASTLERFEALAAKGGSKKPKADAVASAAFIKTLFEPAKPGSADNRIYNFLKTHTPAQVYTLIRAMATTASMKKIRAATVAAKLGKTDAAKRLKVLLAVAAWEAGLTTATKAHNYIRSLYAPAEVWASIKGVKLPRAKKMFTAKTYNMTEAQFARFFGKAKPTAAKKAPAKKAPAKKAAAKKKSTLSPIIEPSETPVAVPDVISSAPKRSDSPHGAARPASGPVAGRKGGDTGNVGLKGAKKLAPAPLDPITPPAMTPPKEDDSIFDEEEEEDSKPVSWREALSGTTDAEQISTAEDFLEGSGWTNMGVRGGEYIFTRPDKDDSREDTGDVTLAFSNTGKGGKNRWLVCVQFSYESDTQHEFTGAKLKAALFNALQKVKKSSWSLKHLPDTMMRERSDADDRENDTDDDEWEARKEKIAGSPNARPEGDMEAEAYDEGQQAAREGLTEDDNPYVNKILAEAWIEGLMSMSVDGDGVPETASAKMARTIEAARRKNRRNDEYPHSRQASSRTR